MTLIILGSVWTRTLDTVTQYEVNSPDLPTATQF